MIYDLLLNTRVFLYFAKKKKETKNR